MVLWILLGVLAIYALFMFLGDRIEAVELAREKALRKPISLSEVEAASRLMEDATLPMVTLEAKRGDNLAPLDTKLAGLPWVPDASHTWPLTETGVPLSFLAQVNFVQMPEMLDFPKKGLLQVFADVRSKLEKRGGAAEAVPHNGDLQYIVRWFPDPVGGHLLARPDAVNRVPDEAVAASLDLFVEMSDRELDEMEDGPPGGWAVEMTSTFIKPPSYILPEPHSALYINDYGAAPRPVLSKKTARALRRLDVESTELGLLQKNHRVGGHPIYLNGQARETVNSSDLDRVLLQLRYKQDAKGLFNEYMTLAISQEDLRAGNFEKAQFFWSDERILDDDYT